MSLKGSLETVALSEVLHLLADNSKTGELYVHGGHVDGRIWFEEGSLTAVAVADAEQPFEAIFELMRKDGGEFEFKNAEVPPATAQPAGADHRDIGPEIERAEARLAEWHDIVAVVPTTSHQVRLVRSAPADQVTVDRSQWEMLVVIGRSAAVSEILSECGLKEFEGCRAVKGLVDASLVEVFEAPVPAVEVQVSETPPTPEAVAEPVVPAETEATADESSHYSELWAAAMEATEDQVPAAEEVAPWSFPGTEEAVPAHVEPAGHDDTQSDEPAPSGREALAALLAEASASTDAGSSVSDEPVDGLKDRGPWTSHELASFEHFDGWQDDAGAPGQPAHAHTDGYPTEAEAPNVVPIRPLSAYDATLQQVEDQAVEYHDPTAEAGEVSGDESEPAEDEAPAADEPINRGLLLKFLSSVRN